MAEIELLSTHFGDVLMEPSDPSTVVIEHFPLPPGFNRQFCELLIDLGLMYPQLPPQDWYISRGLRKYGRKSTHYYEDGFAAKKFCEDGYAWYSFHLNEWRPHPYSIIKGDNLLTATGAFYNALKTD